uniref:Coiled-coil domain-containing protein 51 n=1 Tax=Ascaris suum TaxID=6253 RepID=F1L6Z9_ASCSU
MLSQFSLGRQRASAILHLAGLQRRSHAFSKPIENAIQYYEDLIGLTAIRQAQEEVIQCEDQLSSAQKLRREKQTEIKNLQGRLRDIHTELDRTSRGEDKYLDLLTEEHATIKRERHLMEEFEQAETAEREAFQALSARVRKSHEKERERGERTKYWSVSASLIGALLGIIGTTLAAEVRMRRIKEIVPTAAQLTPMLDKIGALVDKQHDQVASFIGDVRELMHFKGTDKLEVQPRVDSASLERIVSSMNEQRMSLSKEMDELKRLIAVDRALEADNAGIVYVGSDMEMLLNRTERNLEAKMKLQTLLLVVLVYTAIGLSMPILSAIFRGS